MTEHNRFERYKWGTGGEERDVVVSTRVRLARNLKDYPFPPKIDSTGALEIIQKIRGVPGFAEYEYTDFCDIDKNIAVSLAERHIVSPEFASGNRERGLLAHPESGLYIMLLEEDHVRLQSIVSGYGLDKAYETARDAEIKLDMAVNIAYSERFGYLTHCPTNLGTGMRASVMLFLPAISRRGEIASLANQLSKLGLTVRGMSGEGSCADGYLYQVSNQITLGISEYETIKKMTAVTDSIVKRERELRGTLGGEEFLRLRDSVRRAMGIMRYAEVMDTSELFGIYAKVRLGAALGMTDFVTCEDMDTLLFSLMPATVTVSAPDRVKTALDRDCVRAEKLRALFVKQTM